MRPCTSDAGTDSELIVLEDEGHRIISPDNWMRVHTRVLEAISR